MSLKLSKLTSAFMLALVVLVSAQGDPPRPCRHSRGPRAAGDEDRT